MATRAIDHERPSRTHAAVWASWGTARFAVYGLGMLIPAFFFARRYPLRGNAGDLLDIGKLARYQTPEFVWYCVGLAVMFASYVLAAIECRRLPRSVTMPAVFGVGAGLAACFAWMYPVNAIDLYIYAVRSRLWTLYGENPNAVRPEVFWETDPYMRYGMQEWSREVSPYGPLWNMVAAPATLIGGNDIGPALVVFKLIAVAALLLVGFVIFRTVSGIAPDRAPAAALIWLWNPLVLWEGVGNGHNDIVVALPLTLALAAWLRRRYAVVVPLLIGAALLKYVTLLLVPLAAVAVWRALPTYRARFRTAAVGAALSLVACGVAFWPFYDVSAVYDSIRRQGEFISTSPAAVIARWITARPVGSGVQDDVKRVCLGIFALVCLWAVVRVWKRPERLPAAAFEVFFFFLLVATWYFRAWYLVWPVAVVALLPLGWPFARLTAWCAAALGTYAIYIWVWDWWKVEWVEIRRVGVLVTFVPPLVLTTGAVVAWLWRRNRPAPFGSGDGSGGHS